MLELPFSLRYELTRRQRLLPHLRIWRRHAPFIVLGLAIAAFGLIFVSWWYLALLLPLLFIFRGFFVGLLNVVFVRLESMDLIIEGNSLSFLAGKQRWSFGLDGLMALDQLTPNVWTIQHWNGSVVHIPKDLLTDEQVEFFRNWVKEADAIRERLGIKH